MIARITRRERACVPLDEAGQLNLDATVNGLPFSFLLDTGFNGAFSIGRSDARRLGFEITKLDWTEGVGTPNGRAEAAWVRLQEICIAGLVLRDWETLVLPREKEGGGVGMAFLQLVHLKISNGTARLSW